MFHKLVSNLPFSPSLVGQLSFYARRLRQEQVTRRVGLVFVVLALIVQSFAMVSPPEPANAASSADFIRGGVSSINQVLTAYDSGNGDLKDIFTYAGITREEIASAKPGTINSKDKSLLSWGRTHQFSADKGEVPHVVPRKSGGSTTVYSRPLYRWDTSAYTKANGSSYKAFIGHSKKMGWFAIMNNCANLVTKKIPKPAPGGAIAANCDIIKGYAYDGRRPDLKVKVSVYAGGPPGKGELVAQVTASSAEPTAPSHAGSGHGFNVNVPQKYKTADKNTSIYGVMTPLSGWPQSTVSIGQAIIPGNCTPQPVAECTSLSMNRISRTSVSFTASAQVANGATVKGFTFTVKNAAGEIIKQQSVPTNKNQIASSPFDLAPGSYTATATLQSSLGDKTSSQCAKPLEVSPPEKCPLNPNLDVNSPECQPCPGDKSIWIKDENCEAEVVQGKQAANLTQNIPDANGTTAKAGDRIEYTIYVENIGLSPTTTSLEEELSDVLEYGTLRETGGGTFNDQTKRLRWDNVSLKPGEKQTRKFVIEISTTIPATPQGVSNPTSYDCKITNTFGNTVEMDIDCPVAKGVENTVTELPKTGPGENIAFAGIVLAVAVYFYFRSRQLGKEVRLVRREFSAGTI